MSIMSNASFFTSKYSIITTCFLFNPLLKSVSLSEVNIKVSKVSFFIDEEIYKNVEKKCFTLNEVIDYLDNLEVFTDDSDNEYNSNLQSAKDVYSTSSECK